MNYTRTPKLTPRQQIAKWAVVLVLNIIGLPILGIAGKLAWYLLKFGWDLL